MRQDEKAYKYLFVIQSLQMGGAERSLVNLANFFASQGDAVCVLLFSPGGMLEQELAANVERRVISTGSGLTLLRLRGVLRRQRDATVISFLFHANSRLTLLKKLLGVRNRLIITEHSSPTRYAGGSGFKARVRRACGRFFLPVADGIFAVSPLVKDDFSRVFSVAGERIKVVPNPFDQTALETAARGATPQGLSEVKGDRPVLCGVGRLVAEKGFDVLIEAFSRLPGDAVLVIVGDGPERKTLEGLIARHSLEPRVRLVGFDANPYRYMVRADLLVVPSRQEGFGNVIIEAAMLGVPVIATDCIGPRYIYSEEQRETLVPPESADLLAQAIAQGLRAPGELPVPDYRRFRIEDIAAHYRVARK